MIKLSHLRKEYPSAVPLKDVSVQIKKGDIIAIIGPSGTGKSTLIRCINRLDEPTSGQIFIDGEEITAPNYDKSNIGKKVGMVFQHFNLFPHLTAVENVMIAPMDNLGLSKDEAYKRAIALLRKVGLGDKGLNYPKVMSGGQKQRVAIARALAMQPEILLLDEPTSALDPTMVNEVQAVIKDLAKQGTTMMIVTHEMKFAQEVANRVFYMDQGEIYEDGPPDQIFNHPQKERTRQFIQQLRVLRYEVESEDFDFYGMNSEIEEFGRKHRMSQKMINNIQAYLEEMAIQILSITLKTKLAIMIEYSEAKDECLVRISYKEKFDPMESPNELSLLLAQKAAKSIQYEYKEEESIVTAYF